MEQQTTHTSTDRSSLIKRMLLGAGIALALITVFMLKAGASKPEWGIILRIKPYFIVPLAGAAGAAFSWFMDPLRYKGGWRKAVAIIASLIFFIFTLWIGTVLGLNGTHWD